MDFNCGGEHFTTGEIIYYRTLRTSVVITFVFQLVPVAAGLLFPFDVFSGLLIFSIILCFTLRVFFYYVHYQFILEYTLLVKPVYLSRSEE